MLVKFFLLSCEALSDLLTQTDSLSTECTSGLYRILTIKLKIHHTPKQKVNRRGEKSGGGHTTLQSNFCLTVRIKTPVFDLTVGFFFSSLSYIGLTKGSKNLIQPTPPTPYTHLFTSCMYVHIGAYEPCKNMYLA